ncbi:MAG: hypothetical protein JO257_32310 [Deltaproteobacteria bacterium]|nr:hypothetical protein [Deltaproteobacteria bacterium]
MASVRPHLSAGLAANLTANVAACTLALVACKSSNKSAPGGAPGAAVGSAAGGAGARGAGGSAGSASDDGAGGVIRAGSGTGSALIGGGSGDPWSKAAAPAVPDTPEQRKARAAAALSRVEGIMPKLAKVRDLTFEHAVPTEYQTTDDFRKYLQKEIQKELPTEKAKGEAEAFLHVGLFQKPIDLAAVLEQTMATQAGAYYDPQAKKFFLVMVPANDMMLDTMSAHELTHGLQDQHFDLTKYLEPKGTKLDDDQANARRFVVEGDATFTMLLYAVAANAPGAGSGFSPTLMSMLETQVKQFSDMDLSSFADMTKQQSALMGGMDPEIKKSVEAMDSLPPAVLVPLVVSYTKGALVSAVAYKQGGWKAVDELYAHPPESTEQVLHPETKLFPTRDRPHKVTLPKATGTELENNVLGELMWQVYFSLWTPKAGTAASEGWGGDHYVVTRRADNHLVAQIATVWDTPDDAKQFYDGYVATLSARFAGADVSHPDTGVARSDFGKVWVKLAGTKVFIVDGGDDPKLIDQLAAQTKFD